MALIPDYLRLTPDESAQLQSIRAEAKKRHEAARKAALKKGRKDWPLLPYECSWAFETDFLLRSRGWRI